MSVDLEIPKSSERVWMLGNNWDECKVLTHPADCTNLTDVYIKFLLLFRQQEIVVGLGASRCEAKAQSEVCTLSKPQR